MRYGSYRLLCTINHDAVLPVFKGSAFRGGFGHALKKTVCALRRAECAGCLLKGTCVYFRVFEPNGWGFGDGVIKEVGGLRPNALPHPFVIEPPETGKRSFPKGTAFDFGLLLFGEANEYLAYFIYAFEQLGRAGLGERLQGRRGGFTLDQVISGSDEIYTKETGRLDKAETPALFLEPYPPSKGAVTRVRVTFESPLRLKHDNRLMDGLPFHVLVRAMLRRISTLSAVYGGGEPDLDYKGLVKRAEQVAVLEKRLVWLDVTRYSSRQEKAMRMGGVTGFVTYEGDLDEYRPFFDFCERVHLGKETTFGLGKIRVETV